MAVREHLLERYGGNKPWIDVLSKCDLAPSDQEDARRRAAEASSHAERQELEQAATALEGLPLALRASFPSDGVHHGVDELRESTIELMRSLTGGEEQGE